LFSEEESEDQPGRPRDWNSKIQGIAEGVCSVTKAKMSNRFENVWDAIEENPAVAENMKLRSSLMVALGEYIARQGLTQSQAAKIFGVTQPRISDLMRGRIDLFAIDTLVNMLATAGLRVELRVADAA
jgi:predicted XRE-type DNA-binding protein